MELCECQRYLHNQLRPANDGQILHEIDWFQHHWHTTPKVFLAYDRIAMFSPDNPDLRITFDQNIRWRNTQLTLSDGDWGYPLLSGDQKDCILMEIKIPNVMPLWLSSLLDEAGIYPTSFSKYGFCYQNYIFPKIHQTHSLGGKIYA